MKPIFKTKTFWINAAGCALWFAGYLPPKWGPPTMAALNIVNRFLTVDPVNLFGD